MGWQALRDDRPSVWEQSSLIQQSGCGHLQRVGTCRTDCAAISSCVLRARSRDPGRPPLRVVIATRRPYAQDAVARNGEGNADGAESVLQKGLARSFPACLDKGNPQQCDAPYQIKYCETPLRRIEPCSA